MSADPGSRPADLIGRETELDGLLQALDALPNVGSTLLLYGEPGIGKSALLEVAIREARLRGLPLLSATGIPSESDRPFAALDQLLGPILDRARDLPARLRDALLTAMGSIEGQPPERFLLGLATLELLALAATEVPAVLTVEDLHWIDPASADVLAFVARRIESEPVLLVAASRQGPEVWPADGAARAMHVLALDDAASDELLDRSAIDDPALRRRLLELAAGNPLALVELPQAADRSWLVADRPDLLVPLTSRLERSFAARTADLPQATRTVLLVAAIAEGLRTVEAVEVARRLLSPAADAIDVRPAIRAGLIADGPGGLRFLHPLMRSAVQLEAGPEACRSAHAAVSEVLADDPERAVWHRAAAARGHDDAVATDLAASADVAIARGALADAARRLERAAALSSSAAAQAELLLRSAELAAEINDWLLANALLQTTWDLDLDPVQAARRERTRESFGEVPYANATRIQELVSCAQAAGSAGAVVLSLTLLLDAALRCFWTLAPQEERDAVVRTTEALPVPVEAPIALAIFGMADPESCRETIIFQLDALGGALPASADDARLLGLAAYGAGAFEQSMALMTHAAGELRNEGRLSALAPTLIAGSWAAIALGELDTALPAAEEGERLAAEAGLTAWAAAVLVAQGVVAGLQGRADDATRLVDRAEQLLGPDLPPVNAAGLYFARGVTAFASGRYEQAYDWLSRSLDPSDPAFSTWDYLGGLGYLADFAVLLGREDAVRAQLETVGVNLDERPSNLSRPGQAHALAVLAGRDLVFEEALETTMSPFDRARLQLAHGTSLRRRGKAAPAREPLRVARDEFDRLGALPWGDLARRELEAAGETSDRRTTRAWERLSGRELQIARLAASGLSNKEIGSALFYSHRTVASHLSRIYPKLGISSREQLGDALGVEHEGPSPEPPTSS